MSRAQPSRRPLAVRVLIASAAGAGTLAAFLFLSWASLAACIWGWRGDAPHAGAGRAALFVLSGLVGAAGTLGFAVVGVIFAIVALATAWEAVS